MRAFLFVLVASAVWWASVGANTPAQSTTTRAPLYSFAEPGISPDGREIAFVSGGDIWSVPSSGGDARLLAAHEATERRPLYSPDGQWLAFMSTRTGGGDIYVLSLATGALSRVTHDDGPEQLDAWSPDSRWIYFSSSTRDIGSMNDIFRVARDGGTPMPVTDDRYVNEFSAAPAPDGQRFAFVARGVASTQWWRNGSSHLDQSELWLREANGAYLELTPRDAKQEWPMWSADGKSIFYVSDRRGVENLWAHSMAGGGVDRAITSFKSGRMLWPSISADGKTIAFERDFGIWTVDPSHGEPRQVPIARRGAPTTPAPARVRETSQFEDLALSPDGKKVAFISRGDVFAASAKDASDATRITSTPAIESQPTWSPDSRRLVYVSARGSGTGVFSYDVASSTETALTTGDHVDLSPTFSADGKLLAFFRDRKELHVLDLATKQDRAISTAVFADALDAPRPVWSSDGKWIAAFVIGSKSFTNVALVPIEGGVPRPVSFLGNVYTNSITWSRDGTFLLFDTRQRTEPGQIARVDLTLRTPKLREDLFRDLFSEPRTRTPEPRNVEPGTPEPRNPGTPEPRSPVFEDIRRRLTLLPLGLDARDAILSPDDKTMVFVATASGQSNLYAYSLDELATERPVARQLTTTPGGKADPQFSPDGKEVYFLDNGRIAIASIDRRDSRPLAVTAEMTSDFSVDKMPVFQQAWTLLHDNFFDASFHGVDWQAERTAYEPRIAGAGTPDEMRRVMSLMIGDLNASHMGITGSGGGAPVVGRLGIRVDAREYAAAGRLRVAEIIPLGPAALTRDLRIGDAIVAVNGRATAPPASLDDLLANTIDRRVVLTVAPGAGGAATREVVIRPTNQPTEKALIYREWVERNREYVLKVSGGRLGYVHMINMSQAALDQLHIDLDTENHARDGVVIDIRNNTGGFVNAYAMDVFSRQSYLRMSLRGLPESPARTVLGQRALELPTILVTNQHSLSDAEDFSEGYRTLKLGPIVGEPTAGWIIYTWDARLVDGSTLRLPRMRVKAADGSDMELHPRPVDVKVTRPIGEALTGQDSQLNEAIRTLLKKLGYAE